MFNTSRIVIDILVKLIYLINKSHITEIWIIWIIDQHQQTDNQNQNIT